MQKSIRQADAKLAGYWALELWESGFGLYCWKRLLTVNAEDCWGILTAEVKALHDVYLVVNEGLPAKQHRGRIFISKATDRHFLFQPLGSLPAEGPGSVGFGLCSVVASSEASMKPSAFASPDLKCCSP